MIHFLFYPSPGDEENFGIGDPRTGSRPASEVQDFFIAIEHSILGTTSHAGPVQGRCRMKLECRDSPLENSFVWLSLLLLRLAQLYVLENTSDSHH